MHQIEWEWVRTHAMCARGGGAPQRSGLARHCIEIFCLHFIFRLMHLHSHAPRCTSSPHHTRNHARCLPCPLSLHHYTTCVCLVAHCHSLLPPFASLSILPLRITRSQLDWPALCTPWTVRVSFLPPHTILLYRTIFAHRPSTLLLYSSVYPKLFTLQYCTLF